MACFWRCHLPSPPTFSLCTAGFLLWCSLWVGNDGIRAVPCGTCATWEGGERQSPGDGQAGGKASLKHSAYASYSSLFGILITVLEGADSLWQRSYGSFLPLTSKILKLMTFYSFFSSSSLITWPPCIAAVDKIYTWRKIPPNTLFFMFSLFPNTTVKACNAKLYIIY